jgi:hypothetical protein
MITLTKEEKAQIINSHIRNLEHSRYSLEIDIIQENAKQIPSTETINLINAQKDEVSDQITALTSELSEVNLLTE